MSAQASTDTVAVAAATPDRPQPYRELGLTEEEYQRIRGLLGRRPTDPELALYSVMWSEHCSYKSSRAYLRQFADKAPPVKGDGEPGALLAGIAGVCNAAGNVVGLMPHPEHAVDALTGPSADGLGFFTSVVALVSA